MDSVAKSVPVWSDKATKPVFQQWCNAVEDVAKQAVAADRPWEDLRKLMERKADARWHANILEFSQVMLKSSDIDHQDRVQQLRLFRDLALDGLYPGEDSEQVFSNFLGVQQQDGEDLKSFLLRFRKAYNLVCSALNEAGDRTDMDWVTDVTEIVKHLYRKVQPTDKGTWVTLQSSFETTRKSASRVVPATVTAMLSHCLLGLGATVSEFNSTGDSKSGKVAVAGGRQSSAQQVAQAAVASAVVSSTHEGDCCPQRDGSIGSGQRNGLGSDGEEPPEFDIVAVPSSEELMLAGALYEGGEFAEAFFAAGGGRQARFVGGGSPGPSRQQAAQRGRLLETFRECQKCFPVQGQFEITEQLLQQRREAGLCLFCGETAGDDGGHRFFSECPLFLFSKLRAVCASGATAHLTQQARAALSKWLPESAGGPTEVSPMVTRTGLRQLEYKASLASAGPKNGPGGGR